MTLEHLTRESFSEQLNTKFRLSPEPDKPVEIELIEVQAHDDVAGQAERFSILFRGPLNYFLQQSIYRMEHEQLGSAEIFIVPIRMDAEGFVYEAVFNRLT
jgi:hypothetical protein